MTDAQDMHLLNAVKRAMGSHYDNTKTCVYNVTALVNKCDDLSELMEKHDIDFKSPKDFYKDRDMPRVPSNNAPKTAKTEPEPEPKKKKKLVVAVKPKPRKKKKKKIT